MRRILFEDSNTRWDLERLASTLSSLAGARLERLTKLPTQLTLLEQHACEDTVRSCYYTFHYRKHFLPDSDTQIPQERTEEPD